MRRKQKRFQKINLPKSTHEQKSISETIPEEEIYNYINKLKIHKSLGNNGYIYEFYNEFRHDLVPLLCQSLIGLLK